MDSSTCRLWLMVLASAGLAVSRLCTTSPACFSISGSGGAGVVELASASQPMTLSSFCGGCAVVSVVIVASLAGGIVAGPAGDLLQVVHRGLHADAGVRGARLHLADGGERDIQLRQRVLVLGEALLRLR